MPDTLDPTAEPHSNDGGDDDSLFGSPPSSPARGRSPSPLALPGGSGSAQNVGALALPGSHLVAELPTNPPASLPLSASASAPTRQSSVPRNHSAPALSQCHPQSTPRASSSSRTSTPAPSRRTRPETTARKARKGKEKERSNTPRPTPPPIPLPSPDEPPPPNFLRNQQALLGLAGMVGGVNPANLAKVRHTRGATAENPIVVEDEPEIQPQPSIGKRPIHPSPSDPAQLPQPSAEQILATLLKQKNIFPVVVSLLRLLAPGAPSLASVPHGYPQYPYPYPYPAPQPQSFARSQTPSQSSASDSRPSTSSGAPPLKRRKLNSVPAGAADWDVPYPFQEGQGPENYRASWEQARGKQLLKDLVQLVQNAAKKAATKAWYTQHVHPRYTHPVPSVLKYYRPATLYYGLERGQSAPPPLAQAHQHAGPSRSQTPGTNTPRAGAPYGYGGGLPHIPVAFPPSAAAARGVDGYQQLPNAFDQLVESLLAAQQQQRHQEPAQQGQQQLTEQATGSAANPTGDPSSSTPVDPASTSADAATSPVFDENTQAFFDTWLEMLNAFPPGDPNDASACSDPQTIPGLTTVMADGAVPISDDMIDPALLGMEVQPGNPESTTTSGSPTAQKKPGVRESITASQSAHLGATSPTAAQPATPSLVDSPSVTASSLADPADRDVDGGEPDRKAHAPVSSWDWTSSDSQEGMKLLDELAGMPMDVDAGVDVDLDAVMREAMSGWEAGMDLAYGVDAATKGAEDAPGNDGTVGGRTADGAQREPCDTISQEADGEHPSARVDDGGPVSQMDHADSQASQPVPAPSSQLNGTAVNSSSQQPEPMISIPNSAHTATPVAAAIVPPLAPTAFPTSVPIAFAAPSPAVCSMPAPVPYPAVPPATARAKGKAKAIPGTGHGIVLGPSPSPVLPGSARSASASGKNTHRRAVVERARELRAALWKEVERAKVALWETTLEQGVLVGFGRELEKGHPESYAR